jgi:hypothetical protein
VQFEYIQFERSLHERLQEEVLRLEEAIRAEEAKHKHDIHSMLSSLQGLSDSYTKKCDDASAVSAPEAKVRMVAAPAQPQQTLSSCSRVCCADS